MRLQDQSCSDTRSTRLTITTSFQLLLFALNPTEIIALNHNIRPATPAEDEKMKCNVIEEP